MDTDRKTYVLVTPRVRSNAIAAVAEAPANYVVTVRPATRSSDQNAKFHAMCSDLAKSDLTWAGKRRTLDQWKALLVSAHAVATGTGGEVVPGIEGEFVAIRESTSRMGVRRAASLIDYTEAFCVSNGVELHETNASGFAPRESEVA